MNQDMVAVLEEVGRRETVLSSMFRAQANAVTDVSPLRAWQCDRRAGKTTGAILDFVIDGQQNVGYEYAYIALTRNSAERIAWPILRSANHRYGLDLHLQETKLRATLPTGCAITLYGADRPQWMERLYGQKLRKVYIDEVSFFRSADVKRLVEDVLEPTVADLEGQITLMSRPGHCNRGYFYDVMHSVVGGWSVNKWSWRDNPNIRKQVERLIERKKRDNKDIEKDPSFRRNWMNEWVLSKGNRVYGAFDPERHGCDKLPEGSTWNYILGIDLGWFDHTAFVIIAWSPQSPRIYVMESFRETEMDIGKAAARVRMYMNYYPGIRIVGDPARRQAFEELRKRTRLPISAADKQDKRHWIDLINSDLAGDKISIVKVESSDLAEEMMDLAWLQRPNGNIVEQPGVSNDACDAFLYAYRQAHHYRYRTPEKKAEVGSRRWYREQADVMLKAAEKEFDEEEEQA